MKPTELIDAITAACQADGPKAHRYAHCFRHSLAKTRGKVTVLLDLVPVEIVGRSVRIIQVTDHLTLEDQAVEFPADLSGMDIELAVVYGNGPGTIDEAQKEAARAFMSVLPKGTHLIFYGTEEL